VADLDSGSAADDGLGRTRRRHVDAYANPAGNISMSVSLNGVNTFEVGNVVSQYQVGTTGAITLGGSLMQSTAGSSARQRAFKEIIGLNHTNLQRVAYADVLERAIAPATC
jgi:hypothetical protein